MRLKKVDFFDDKYINLFTVQTHLLVEACITHLMYIRLTNMHQINNLIGWKLYMQFNILKS